MIPLAGRRRDSLPARSSSIHSTWMSRKCDSPLASAYRLWMRMPSSEAAAGPPRLAAADPRLLSQARLVADHQGFPQDVGLELQLVQSGFDHVTDADDPAQAMALHHRQMTNAVAGHSRHDRRDAVLGRAGGDLRCHQLG